MTHTTEQPEALRLAEYCDNFGRLAPIAKELRHLHARVQELEASKARRATQTTDSSEVISNEELQQAFSGTNFGTDDFRGLLHVAILKKACNYHCGYTITTIMKDLRLIGTNGQPRKRGIALLRAAYSNQMQGGS